MRFKAVVLRNEKSLNTKLELLKREIENNSITAEDAVKVLSQLIGWTETNIELLEKEYEQELV